MKDGPKTAGAPLSDRLSAWVEPAGGAAPAPPAAPRTRAPADERAYVPRRAASAATGAAGAPDDDWGRSRTGFVWNALVIGVVVVVAIGLGFFAVRLLSTRARRDAGATPASVLVGGDPVGRLLDAIRPEPPTTAKPVATTQRTVPAATAPRPAAPATTKAPPTTVATTPPTAPPTTRKPVPPPSYPTATAPLVTPTTAHR